MELNKNQLEAVNHKGGPLLIIAGAGTGKTAVITERIVNIVEKGWAKPSEILALTFMEKAAAEMEERVDIAMPYGYEEMWISTFHAFCDRVLKQDGVYIGLDTSYKMMTKAESYILFRKHLFEFPLDKLRPLGSPTRFIDDIITHFSRLQDEDISDEEYIVFAKSLPRETEEERERYEILTELSETYAQYNKIKIEESKLDFGDLVSMTIRLFRQRPGILKKYHDRFKYILVDEYQDTNYTQNVLVNMLALGVNPDMASEEMKKEANITVVGDDDQSIYKFRGAAISNIIQFKQQYPTAKKVVLTDNYRSKQEILDSAYRLISNNNPYRLEVTESISKRLIASGEFEEDGGSAVNVIFANRSSGEADSVVEEILKLTKDGRYSYSDIAILVRAHNHSDEFVQALSFKGVPYKFGGARGLYNRDEVSLLISFLRCLADYSDEVSMFNLLSMPQFHLNAREVVEILKIAKERRISTFEVIEKIVGVKAGEGKMVEQDVEYRPSSIAMEGLVSFVGLFDKGYKMMKKGKGVGEILFMFFDDSGYKDSVLREDSVQNHIKVDNLRRYFDLIAEYERGNPGSNLYEYLGFLDYSMEIGQNPSVDQSLIAEYEGVNIMTVHGCKGLEFPVVFLVNLVDQRFPGRNRSDAFPVPDELIREVAVVESERESHKHEERRLFYVGATRAKELLYLTAANYYTGNITKKKPSIFLSEILGRDVREELAGVSDEEAVTFPVHHTGDPDIIDWKSLNLKPSDVFSYSQLSTYERCPREYKYRYVLGLPTPASSHISFGSSVHDSLRAFYERIRAVHSGIEGVEMPEKTDLLALFESFWRTQGYDTAEHEQKQRAFGEKILREYLEKFDYKNEQPLEIEKKFKYAIQDVKITGVVDRMDLVKEGVVDIYDYKTGRPKNQKDANKEWQLVLYSMAVEELMGLSVQSASYIYLENGTQVVVDVNEGKKEVVRKKVLDIVGKIRAGDFTVPRGHTCEYCNFGRIGEGAIL